MPIMAAPPKRCYSPQRGRSLAPPDPLPPRPLNSSRRLGRPQVVESYSPGWWFAGVVRAVRRHRTFKECRAGCVMAEHSSDMSEALGLVALALGLRQGGALGSGGRWSTSRCARSAFEGACSAGRGSTAVATRAGAARATTRRRHASRAADGTSSPARRRVPRTARATPAGVRSARAVASCSTT